ncbi:MAG: LysM peptidoglycan-binding domain-containing protein [Octadecabacter sp.]
MSEKIGIFASSGGTVAAAGAAVAVAVIAGVLVVPRLMPDPVEPEIVIAAPEAAPTVVPEPAAPIMAPPSFDVTFIYPDGTGTVAGRALAGEMVALLLDGQEIDRVQADAQGAFVALLALSPSAQPRVLDLLADPDGTARAAAESRIIGPISAPVLAQAAPAIVDEPEVEIAAADPVTPTPAAPIVETPVTEESVAETPAAEPVVTQLAAIEPTIIEPVTPEPVTPEPVTPEPETPEPTIVEPTVTEPTAPAILSADAEGVRVLQPAALSDIPPEVTTTVALDTITYDPDGDVLLGGRAAGEGFVRVYLDNQPITTSRISLNGDWRTDLPQVDTGIYTLRVDEVDTEGTVVSRIETPFQREEPAVVAAAMAEETATEGFRVAVKTVQPGATLWAIAQERYGSGVMYVRVFEANRERIRDPDLIYAGQVFVIPEDRVTQ